MSVFYEHNHRATCSPIGWFSILGTAGLHLTPCCSVPKPKPAIESASSSSRLRQQAASFMAVLSGGQASLSTRPIADSSKHSTVKRPAVDGEPPSLHSSTPTSAFPLYISDLLSISYSLLLSLSPSLAFPFHCSKLNVAWSLTQLSPLIFPAFSYSHTLPSFVPRASRSLCALFSRSFCAPSLGSDCSNDTAGPAVISLITFKQLSVAFSPSICLPPHSLPLIACSFLCQCLKGGVFHYLTAGDKYSYSACILPQQGFYMWA